MRGKDRREQIRPSEWYQRRVRESFGFRLLAMFGPRALPRINNGVYTQTRNLSQLKQKLAEQIPKKQAEIKEIKEKFGEEILGTCTVSQAYGGMRSVKSLVTETSLLDADEGIRFRGLTIPECQKQLPKAPGGEEPLPEGIFWLLLTGEVPTQAEVNALSKDLANRSKVPSHVTSILKSLPKEMHPMTQFNIGINALQTESEFFKAYQSGVSKNKYWEHAYEDTLNLVARLPHVAASIYKNTYKDGKVAEYDSKLDWGANFANMLGFNDPKFTEMLRLYLSIHSDHEGGNVSAHTTHLVGSALSDPYLSYAAGMNGLAGPLHGLANQEVLRWTQDLRAKLGNKDVSNEELTKAVWDTLNSGQVVPGFGHAVLRKTDPRYMCQREFAQKHLPNDPLFKLVSQLFEVVPKVLTEHGKTKNPFPNVDAHSGVLLTYYGLTEENYYTVLFGASRALGVLPSLIWDRALGFPIERPKSVTTEWIKKWSAGLKK
eukprot:TRINITY_DN2556_c0_g1_i1.p1 TRINITY_DN2556_c0_g1~~TRINITY_DN2556_c0_g1_i1.p1  ORF type:complete len:488 (-),score=143.04 TRINITY_DN2556_c0_g1_i1:38-1501(-)